MDPTTTVVVTTSSQLATWLSKVNAPASRRWFSSSFRVGTNAAVSAPSPRRRRNRLGRVEAV